MCDGGYSAIVCNKSTDKRYRAAKAVVLPFGRGGDGIRKDLERWLILLGVVNLFNLFYTVNIFYTRQVVLVHLASLSLCWIAFQVMTDKRLRILKYVLISAAVIVSIETMIQWYAGKGVLVPWSGGQPVGTIGNTNYLGAYLLFAIFACLSLLPTERANRYTILFSLLTICVALVISRARAAWIGLLVGGTVWAWMVLPKRYFLSLVAIGCLAGVILWVSLIPNDWKSSSSLGYRLKYWQAAVELWKESPLVGIGFDGYRNQVYEAQARINERNPGWFEEYQDPKPRRVHNEYLQALVDGGIIYFVTFFGFIAWIMGKSYRMAKESYNLMGVWCAQIAILVTSLFFFPFRLVDTTMLFHINLGVLCASSSSQS